jgi:hypothetical protein
MSGVMTRPDLKSAKSFQSLLLLFHFITILPTEMDHGNRLPILELQGNLLKVPPDKNQKYSLSKQWNTEAKDMVQKKKKLGIVLQFYILNQYCVDRIF